MIRKLFFRNSGKSPDSGLPDEVLAQQARQKYDEFLQSCSELKQRGYLVQLCFSHLDRSKSFRPDDLVRIDVEVSNSKHI